MWKLLAVGVLCAFLGLVSCRTSPCPDRFEYRDTREAGKWAGTINLLSEYSLHGVWVRLIFDRPINELRVDGKGFDVANYAADENPTNEVLIKNRDILLKKNVPTPVDITVVYEGDNAPVLTGYRLNARDVCPFSNE